MTIRLVLAALLLLAPASARAQQMTIYDWSAAINLGFGVLNQMMGMHRQFYGNGYAYGVPYGGQAFGTTGQPGWHLRGQQGWAQPPAWGLPQAWGAHCQPQLMQNPMGQRAIVDPCTGQVLQWVR